ncbi:hypothetical protein GCM10027085_27760 [Spirosoma aerophilum]
MSRLVALLTLLSAGPLSLLAQPISRLPTLETEREPKWVVQFAPLSLFDPSNTIQFGVERMIGQRQSIHIEAGYGWQGMNLWQTSTSTRYTNTENWRGRIEWRYYWRGGPIGPYVAMEGLFKQVTAREQGTVGVGCDLGDCQYYQRFSSPITKHVWGGHVKFGRQFFLSPNHRLVGDFYGGLGVRWRSLDRYVQPANYYYYESRGFTLFDPFTNSPYPIISLSYGIKLGYAF